jgi:hypothetical protein
VRLGIDPQQSPVAQPFYVVRGVVAVAVAVSPGWRQRAPLLPNPQPLRAELKLACGLGYAEYALFGLHALIVRALKQAWYPTQSVVTKAGAKWTVCNPVGSY